MKKRNAAVFLMFFLLSSILLPLLSTPLAVHSEMAGANDLFMPAILKPQPKYWIQSHELGGFSEIELTALGNMVIAGSIGSIDFDGAVVKTQPDGTLLWIKKFEGSFNNNFADIAVSQDGGYWASGRLHLDNSSYNYAPWLVRFDSDGNVLWQRTYIPTPSSRGDFTDILATPDNGLLVAIRDYFHGTTIAKLNADGTVNWARELDPAEDATIVEMKATPDGGYILVGNTYKIIVGYEEHRTWVVKTNANGAVAWQKYYGFDGLDQSVWRLTHSPFSVVADSGGYTVAVHTNVKTIGSQTISLWVLRLNTSGNVVWQKQYVGADNLMNDMVATQDGGYVIVGADERWLYFYNPWVLKINNNGAIVWQRTYSDANRSTIAYSVRETSTADLLVLHGGPTLFKMNSQGVIESCSCWKNDTMTASTPLFYTEVVTYAGQSTSLAINNTTVPVTNPVVPTGTRLCPETSSACYIPNYPGQVLLSSQNLNANQ